LRLQNFHGERIHETLLPFVSMLKTQTRLPICSLLFCKSEINKDPSPLGVVVEKVGWLDVTVQYAGSMNAVQCQEEALEVVSHVVDQEVSIVETKVEMTEIRKHSHDLIQVTERSQEWADMWRIAESMEKFKFIGNAMRRGCDIDLLERNELWLSLRFLWPWFGSGRGQLPPLYGWCVRISILN
jgi:hypothetical protein